LVPTPTAISHATRKDYVDGLVAAHAGNTSNPHGTTAAQVGAATPGDVAAAVAGKVGSATVTTIWTGTQAQYNQIAVPDPGTMYVING